jgi:flagellar protein FlaJ
MFRGIALKMFGRMIEPYTDYFDALKENLKKARMAITVNEYLSCLFLGSLISFIASMITASVFVTMRIIDFAYSYTLCIILSFLIAGTVFFFGYYYPSMKKKNLQAHIERALPFATSYMATSASSGMKPVEILKMLSMKGGVMGEEANRIYTNAVSMGMNLTVAIQRSANRSPSPQLSDLWWGMASVITSGGNLEEYLRGKSRTFMSQYRRMLNDYARQITLYTEIYITLIIIGSLFFIVLIAIIAPITGINTLFIQSFLVFFLIPMVSMGFIVLLKGISPME